MANRKATLHWHYKDDSGKWRRSPVIFTANGLIKTGVVLVDGKERKYPDGSFHLRQCVGRQTTFRNVGKNANAAIVKLRQAGDVMALKIDAKGTGAEIVVPKEQRTLAELSKDFLAERKLTTRKSGMSAYRTTIRGFFETCRKMYAHDVEKRDVLVYIANQRELGFADRTVFNRFRSVTSFLKWAGVKESQLPGKSDPTPKKPKTEPESYDYDEAMQLIDSCKNKRDALVFELMLKTGLREKEASFLEWWNIDFDNRVVTIRNKEKIGFRIKDNDERDVPLEASLLEKLREWKTTNGERRFVFGTEQDKVEGHFLRALKVAVLDAGMNCMRCEKCIEKDECSEWWLHKFRATFASTCLQRGMDAKTLMKLLGHEDLEVTLKYLSAARTSVVQSKIDNIFGTPKGVVEMPKRQNKRAS